jgi:hypothetical protein
MRSDAMRTRLIALAGMALVLLTACGGGGGGGNGSPAAASSSTPDLRTRPSSPAVLTSTSPAQNQAVTGKTVHVVVSLRNATVVQATTTTIDPTEGHVHLFLDNQLIYMGYTLAQDVPVKPGVYSLKAEFVAADHFPFNPRVYSEAIVFQVTQ